jgi:sialic acid synthase SpsE
MITFGRRKIGAGHPCLIVAELGTSHGGDIERAKSLINAAVRSGADCIKFQLVYADEILHPLSGLVELPTGKVALYQQFKKLERDLSFYSRLKEYTEASGALFLCTPFGIRSARELRSLGVQALKIASPELNHFPLLQEVAEYRLPLFLSSGVSLLGDIERGLAITGRTNTVLMHCITSYPAPEEEYNIRVLSTLAAVLGVQIGLSDHSLDPVLVPSLAVMNGACVVEKHFTLSRRDAGLDDPIALEPADFRRMVESIRAAEADMAAGAGERTRARLAKEYGEARVTAVLGTGVKDLAASERSNYTRTNRSIHALREIQEGSLIGPGDVAILRTEKVLRPGLSPEHLPTILGARAARRIPNGEGVVWEDLVGGPQLAAQSLFPPIFAISSVSGLAPWQQFR